MSAHRSNMYSVHGALQGCSRNESCKNCSSAHETAGAALDGVAGVWGKSCTNQVWFLASYVVCKGFTKHGWYLISGLHSELHPFVNNIYCSLNVCVVRIAAHLSKNRVGIS